MVPDRALQLVVAVTFAAAAAAAPAQLHSRALQAHYTDFHRDDDFRAAISANMTCAECEEIVEHLEGCVRPPPAALTTAAVAHRSAYSQVLPETAADGRSRLGVRGPPDTSDRLTAAPYTPRARCRCFDCTWAHRELPGCHQIMSQITARPIPTHLKDGELCCQTRCACLPTCECPSPPPPPPTCVCVDENMARPALTGLRKFCTAFELHDLKGQLAVWVREENSIHGGHYKARAPPVVARCVRERDALSASRRAAADPHAVPPILLDAQAVRRERARPRYVHQLPPPAGARLAP